ncbi:MAG: cytochrome c, partial [Planctomycetota bacterium]
STLFADGRAMRPRVSGTVPRGSRFSDASFAFGFDDTDFEAALEEDDATERRWIAEAPVVASMEMMERGRQRFNIHCAVCHGRAGYGNGLASQRALELQQGSWIPPTSLHAKHVLEQPDGQLYGAITNGVRKMPAYGHQIPVEDRWAIVLYVRALQRSQNASLDDVPEEIRRTLRERN